MTTAIHQFRKDIRRHGHWLAVWAVLCVLSLGALVLPGDATMAHAVLDTIVPPLRFVVFVVLTVLVVHEDPLVGSTAFWLTRPIGGARLLAGKLLFVGVLLVLPVVAVEAVYVASMGIGTPYLLLAIPEIALDWVVWGTGVLALATLTTTLPGFLGASLAIALLAGGAQWLVRSDLMLLSMLKTLDPWRQGQSFLASRVLATSALLAGLGLAVAALQYRTRRLRVAWATLMLGVLAVVGLRAHWRWDFLELPRAEPTVVDSTVAEKLRVVVDPAGRLESMTTGEGSGAAEKAIYARVRVEGAAQPLVPEIERLDGWLTFAGGSKVRLAGESRFPEPFWRNTTEIERMIGAHFVNLDQEGVREVPVVRLSSSEYDQRTGTSGRLAGTAVVALRSYHIVAELPARPNAAYDNGTDHAVITGIYTTSGDCTVGLRETQVSLLLAPARHAYRSMYLFRFNPDVLYVLRNRERGEAFWPQHGMTVGFGWPSRTRVDEITSGGVYRSNVASDPPLPRIDDAWMAGADVVRLEMDTVGTVVKAIEPSTFAIPGEGATRAGADASLP